MIALMLLDALVSRLQVLFKDYSLPGKSGQVQTVKVFPQFLPQPKGVTLKPRGGNGNDEEDEQEYGPADIESNFPCIVVKLNEGYERNPNRKTKNPPNINFFVFFKTVLLLYNGAHSENRTHDLNLTMVALYRLSYEGLNQ